MNMVKRAGRLVPTELSEIGAVRPFAGVTGVTMPPAFNTIAAVKRVGPDIHK